MSDTRKGIIIAAALLASLAGCSQQEPPGEEVVSEPQPPAEVATETAEPEATVESVTPVLEHAWTDADGYQYSVKLLEASGSATKDVANAKPGEALVSWKYTFSGELTNATPDRNAPFARVVVEPVWPADSPVCTAPIGYLWEEAFNSNTSQWCTVSGMPQSLVGDTPASDGIPMGTTSTVRASGALYRPVAVPEADADAIVGALQTPTMFAIGRQLAGDGDTLLTDCLMESGSFYLAVATGDTGCGTR
ncbi:hypothetical protein [Cellulomonas endometrii]|uniref:hypothetical protein n=1 Tax=Cellulomonas endometrii TaxID=3036301 RepID=UPI0024ACAF01|nr:hypothetical protein [Cellulomonas endometrii]